MTADERRTQTILRVILKGCTQTGVDSWADTFCTVDVPVPDSIALSLKNSGTIAGVELLTRLLPAEGDRHE